MPLRLVCGQNAPLAQRVLRFAVTDVAELDVSAIVVAADLTATSSDDFVFYNQPDTAGVHLRPDGVHVDLDGLPPHASGVLCIVSTDTARGRPAVDAALFDTQGTALVDFTIPWQDTHGALICFELYRRANQWKVRAVGQGYAGGLAQLLGVHGVQVDDDDGAGNPTEAVGGRTPAHVEPLDPDFALERIAMIYEDAARSTAALQSSRAYAEHRLDEDLSAAVADPAARMGSAADKARAAAERRRDELVAEAQTRYAADANQLSDELRAIDHELPRSLSSWQSAAWRSTPVKAPPGDGIRVGEVCVEGGGPLSVPFCLPLPLRRPLWVVTSSPAAAAPVVSALILRLLAATPEPPILDVVDLTGALDGLTGRLAPLMHGGVVRSHLEVSQKLASLVDAVDLAVMGVQGGLSPADVPARVVVLSDFGHGLQVDDLTRIARLATQDARARLSLLIVGADESDSPEPLLQNISHFCEHLPVDTDARVRDPWTDGEWRFTPDAMPTGGEAIAQYLDSLAGPSTR